MTIRFARLNATQPGNQVHEYRTKMLSKFVLNKQIGVKNVVSITLAWLQFFLASSAHRIQTHISQSRFKEFTFKLFAFMSFQKYCMTMPEIEIHINFALKYTKE